MAQQVINVGTTAGDGTGDPGRTAFNKVNANFTDLYSAPTLSGIISAAGFNVTGATLPDNGIYLPSANTLGFAAGTTQWGTLNAGNWVLKTPLAGTTLFINGLDGTTGVLQADAPTDTRFLLSTAGVVYGQLQSLPASNLLRLTAVGAATTFALQVNAVDRITVSAAGNAAVIAPSSGDCLTTNGLGAGSMSIRAQSSADGIMAFIGRAGGTNNPRLQVSTTEASGLTDLNFTGSAGTPNGTISINGTTSVTFASTRAITISAPTGGSALTINSVAGNIPLLLVGTAGVSAQIESRGNGLASGLRVGQNSSGVAQVLNVDNSSLVLGTNNTTAVTIDATQGATFVGKAVSTSSSAGVGYATGAGATVTQATNRSTGVTINAVCGAITLASAAGSTTYASFTVTNSAVAATDVVKVVQKTGTDLYIILVTAVSAGSFRISAATTGGTTTEQPVFSFTVIKAVTA